MTKWRETIYVGDVFHSDDLTIEQKRDAIVATIRASRWFKNPDHSWELEDAVDCLEMQEDTDGFDYEWNRIYDCADADLVWIETMPRREPASASPESDQQRPTS